MKALADGLRELMNTVNNLGTKLDDMAVTVKDLSAKVDRLSPLVPVASNLAALPEKVTALQASAYDNTQQVRALNLAVIRVEKAQRKGKAPVEEEDSALDSAANDLPPQGRPKPPPFAGWPPPRDYFHEEDDYNDTRFHPRACLEFPTFDSKEDPLPWLNRCETFFRGQNTPERHRVWYAAMHLAGAAQLWFYRLEMTSDTPSWRRFAQLVQQRFGPPMTDGAVGKMMCLRLTGTVEDYTDKFMSLACRDADLTELHLVQMYTAGLGNPFKTDVALRRPQSLDDAIMYARAYEQRLLVAPPDQPQGRSTRAPALSASGSSASKLLPAAGAPESAASAAQGTGKSTPMATTLPRRRLSPAEMAQRRTEVLCYNCEEKFVLGHRCKKLFILEVVGSQVEDEQAEKEIECAVLSGALVVPGISLHAVTGIRAKGIQTMKVFVSIGGAVVVALLDSGSSHNFIDVDMARRAGVPLQPGTGLSVTVANGDRIPSPGSATEQVVHIGGEAFHVNVHALPLGEYDMVLGI
jgi:hypothetical protein